MGVKEEQKRLETAMLEFIEKTLKEPSTESSIAVIPEIARELINLWDLFGD